MKFDTTLKPQDKRTIAIVLYIAVVALFCWYMIRPAAMKFVELDDKIRAAEATKQEYKMKTMQLDTAEILYNKAVTDIKASTEKFYDVMDNSKIEKMGTAYILRFGLTPVDFTVDIRDGSYIVDSQYTYAKIKNEVKTVVTPEPTKKVTTKNKNSMAVLDVKSLQAYYAQAIAEVNTTEPAEIQCANISIVIQGQESKCQALIDDITKNPSIRVTGFTWGDAKEIWIEDAAGNKTLINPGFKELKLKLCFFMTEKPNFENKEA